MSTYVRLYVYKYTQVSSLQVLFVNGLMYRVFVHTRIRAEKSHKTSAIYVQPLLSLPPLLLLGWYIRTRTKKQRAKRQRQRRRRLRRRQRARSRDRKKQSPQKSVCFSFKLTVNKSGSATLCDKRASKTTKRVTPRNESNKRPDNECERDSSLTVQW